MLFTVMTGVADRRNGCHRTTTGISSAFDKINFGVSRVLLYTVMLLVEIMLSLARTSGCHRKTVRIRSAVVNLHTASSRMLLFFTVWYAVSRRRNACRRTSTSIRCAVGSRNTDCCSSSGAVGALLLLL